MPDPHPETAAALAALEARMTAAERERQEMRDMLLEIQRDVKAMRTISDRGSGALHLLAYLGGSGGALGFLAAAWALFHRP